MNNTAIPTRRELQERLHIAVGRVMRRSDVVVTRYVRMSSAQPFGKRKGVMPEDMEAVFDAIGATSLSWRFADDPDDQSQTRGSLDLRGADNRGWWDVALSKSSQDTHRMSHGFLHRDGWFLDADSEPLPKDTQHAIIEGQDEWGVVLLVHGDGSAEARTFNSDRETRAMPRDGFLPSFLDFLDGGLVGTLGRPGIAYASTGKPDTDVRERLAVDVPPRITADVEVLENRAVDWQEYRGLALSQVSKQSIRKLAKVLDIPELGDLTPEERGLRIAAATAEKKVSPAFWKAVNEVVYFAKKTKKDFEAWRQLEQTQPQSVLRLRIRRRRTGLPYGAPKSDSELGRAVTVELPGFAPDDSFPIDRARFFRRGIDETKSRFPIQQMRVEPDGDAVLITVTAPTAWVQAVEVGTYESPVLEVD